MGDPNIERLEAEADRWKSIAEANDRSYCIARDALEMTRKALAEMTTYRDNAAKRLEWSERDRKEHEASILVLKRQINTMKRGKGKRSPRAKDPR